MLLPISSSPFSLHCFVVAAFDNVLVGAVALLSGLIAKGAGLPQG